MINLRFAPLHEIVENELVPAINVPGMAHIRTRTVDLENGGRIDFLVMGECCGVSLTVYADGSYVLAAPDEPGGTRWTADEAYPQRITDAVLVALRARVRAAA